MFWSVRLDKTKGVDSYLGSPGDTCTDSHCPGEGWRDRLHGGSRDQHRERFSGSHHPPPPAISLQPKQRTKNQICEVWSVNLLTFGILKLDQHKVCNPICCVYRQHFEARGINIFIYGYFGNSLRISRVVHNFLLWEYKRLSLISKITRIY